jgi:diguanylate cyclase (GGDEF)-like protein
MNTINCSILHDPQSCQAILDALPANALLLDSDGTIIAVNAAWRRFCVDNGNADGIGVGDNYLSAGINAGTPESDGSEEASVLVRAVLSGHSDTACFVYPCHAPNRKRWFRLYAVSIGSAHESAGARPALVMHFDVTDTIAAEQRLFDLAHLDSLTGLPNRLLFLDRLRHGLAQTKRQKTRLALLFIDLDRFKNVNDTLGHQVGDELLKQVARRLSGCLRESDTVGRLGGDEFALLLPDISDEQNAETVACKIVNALAQPFHLAGQDLFCGASIGIALHPEDAVDPEHLMQYADTAMYQAKEAGRNTWRFHTPALNERAQERLRLDADLRLAVQRNEFELFYQPKLDLRNGQIVGVEALLRWHHPVRGLVSPLEFVPVLEDTGLINEVGRWAITRACEQLKAWHDAGLTAMSVAVNLSARQFEVGGGAASLAATVEEILGRSGLAPQFLELELTESALMSNADQVAAALAELRGIGLRISVDDFGTGYSSLSYLKRFPLDAVKVDRSFIEDIAADPDDASITRAVITMAHNLKLKVIAEGVESEGQLALLAASYCDEIQGFLFSKPVPATEMEAMLVAGRTLAVPTPGDARPERTLLLVDDEENILAALKRLLRRDGYRILTANGGSQALELLAQNKVDVIVSDQRMPNMTGVEFLRRARTIHPDTVRIVLSGYTELQSITDAINEGAIYKFLTKPWDDELLRANIEEAFRQGEMADDNRRLAEEVRRTNRELAHANSQLQALLDDKQQQLQRDEATLDVAQEILQEVPTAIVGIDDDNLIVFANEAADHLLGNGAPLLGDDAARLPAIARSLLAAGGEGECPFELADRSLRLACRRMRGRSSGRLLMVLE